MAVGQISLTSGMRANLNALQNTSKLLDQTQRRLSTGKKVNSALDNPTNFFAAKAHTNRASDLASLKDGMSEAIQVVKAADQGISAVTEMIESAKGLAQAAQTASNEQSTQATITGTALSAGDTITINGQTFTAANMANATSGNFFAVANATGSTALSFSAALVNLDAAITANDTFSGNVNITGAAGTLTISATGTDFVLEGISETGAALSAAGNNNRGERYDLAQQYNSLMEQLDTLVTDAHYKGADTNLIEGQTLTISFEGSHTLEIEGFSAKAADLGGGIATSSNDWAVATDITTDIGKLDDALSTLRNESKSLASNLAVINTRQDFTSTMITTLTDGSDNLTLADMNEEGANMLMLQTRQSLATTSLSLSSQAAQAVLRLF
jgi:flagellin-like hook-associated protein FlgL